MHYEAVKKHTCTQVTTKQEGDYSADFLFLVYTRTSYVAVLPFWKYSEICYLQNKELLSSSRLTIYVFTSESFFLLSPFCSFHPNHLHRNDHYLVFSCVFNLDVGSFYFSLLECSFQKGKALVCFVHTWANGVLDLVCSSASQWISKLSGIL